MLLTTPKRTVKLRRYLKHIIISAGKVQDSKLALQKVHNQIDKVKNLADLKGSKIELDKEIEGLKKHIGEFIRKDKKLKLSHHEPPYTMYQDLNDKISNLDRKLSLFVSLQEQRQEKFQKIEKNVRKKVQFNKEKIESVGFQIKRLEQEYKKIARSGKYDRPTLSKMKKRLDGYKKKLKTLKKK